MHGALLEGGEGTVKYPPDCEVTLRPKNESSHSILFTWNFVQGNLQVGRWVDNGQGIHSYSPQSLDLNTQIL